VIKMNRGLVGRRGRRGTVARGAGKGVRRLGLRQIIGRGGLADQRRINALTAMLRGRQNGERDAEQHEDGRQDRRRTRQEVCCAPRRHQARGAAAHAKTATFRTLHQDDRDEHKSDHGLDDEKEGEKHV
jgi:hypothetical protein